MERFFTAAGCAFGSLFAPGMFGVFFKSVAITILALMSFVILTVIVVGQINYALHPTGDTNGMVEIFSGFFAATIAWFLFPGIMPVIVNFFDARIAQIIEQEDYGAAPPAQAPPFWPEFWHDVRFSLLAVGLNILALPFYFIPMVNMVLFYLLNGYLLGREFFMMAARRRMPIPEANALRLRHSRVITLAGAALAFLATVPFANLIAPFWGIAMMVHLYHSLAKA